MDIFISSEHIISSLGLNTSEHLDCIESEKTGIKTINNSELYPEPVQLGLIDRNALYNATASMVDPKAYTLLETMMLFSISQAASQSNVPLDSPRTLFVFSTTKGNIDLINPKQATNLPSERRFLSQMAQAVCNFFNNPNKPVIISNACISGVLAIDIAARLIRTGMYDHAVVCGGDVVSEFVISGFQSFKSISPTPCKPYDAQRDGLSLGEGCATVILSNQLQQTTKPSIRVLGGASSNDANHISGPSRTGDGLFFAIRSTLQKSNLQASDIDYICAHGTATSFNDEMESKAVNLAKMSQVPINSFKGYIGHTLGAAGVIESVLSIASLQQQKLFKTLGYQQLGVPEPITVIDRTAPAQLRTCLKMASGFGGCNAALIFQTVN